MATQRQKKVLKEIAENSGNMGNAMRKAGYSDNYANSPDKIKKTKGWKELMDKHLPDSLLAEKHRALLNKTELDKQPDTQAVRAGLDMAYKLKGKYATDKLDIDIKSGGKPLSKQGGIFKKALKTGLRGRGHSKVDSRKRDSNRNE